MSNNATSAVNQQGSLRQLADDPPETTRQIPQMSEKLAILLGLLYTDGCVSPKGASSWRIYFSNKSKVLIELFRDCITDVFELDVSRVRIGNTSNGYLKAVVDSKEVGSFLTIKYGTFRTLKFKNGVLPEAKLPVSELVESGYENAFLRTAFSCDGGLCLYRAQRSGARGGTSWLIRNAFLACAHPRLRTDYLFLLEKLKIEVSDIPEDGKLRIQTQEGIRKFHHTIGFIPGVNVTEHSRFWNGYEKQQLLELMIDSYGNPSKVYNLPKFHLR